METKNKKSAKEVKVENVLTLDQLNAIGITENLKSKTEGKKIFKAEFNNKKDRTACRTKFLSAVSMYLLHTVHGKKDLADKELESAKAVAIKYYVAEDKFENVADYATSNMEDNKRKQIDMFLQQIKK